MFGFIGMLIVGGLIGWAAGAIMGKDIPGGILGNIIAGIIGSWLGGTLLGHWGPELGSIHLTSFNWFNYLNCTGNFNFKSYA